MANVISAPLVATGLRFAVIAGRFNEFITSSLLSACLDSLKRHGADEDEIDVVWCPGAYEIPLVAKYIAGSGRYDAVICLGTVIRGATPHFDYVAGECAKGVSHVALETGVPTIFGIITADNIEQAVERAGTKAGNKGADAAVTAIEMANLVRELKPEQLTAVGRTSSVMTGAAEPTRVG